MGFSGNTASVVGLVVGLTVSVIVAAFLIPVGVDPIVEDEEVTISNHNVSEKRTLQHPLSAEVTAVDTTNNNVDVRLNDSATGESTTLTISEGASQETTLDQETVNATVNAIVDTDTADMTYQYPPEYGWSDGGQSLWRILDLAIVLGLFMAFIGVAFAAKRKVS